MNDIQEQKCNFIESQYNVIEKLYNNLRLHFDRVIDHILGKDYVNYGLDVYSSDKMTCDDIINEYLKVKRERDSWKKTAIIFGIAFICMSLITVFVGVH